MKSLSIIIPIYKVEKYIERCILSIMQQTYRGVEIECILVDDCSPDQSMSLVNKLMDKYFGDISFKIIRHDMNRGLSAARNTGVLHAQGDYVMFIDSDDYLVPDSIQYFFDNYLFYPDVDMIMGNVKDCKSGNLLISKIQPPKFIDDLDVIFSSALRCQLYLYAWNKLIKRQLLLDSNIFFEEGILYEDQCWSYQLFSEISSLLLLPRVTYVYENNPNSIVNANFTQGQAEKVIWSYKVSVNKMLNNPPSPSRYKHNMAPQYLLFMLNYTMKGVDIMSQHQISSEIAKEFRNLKRSLLTRSFCYGRILITCFSLFLFTPFNKIQKWRLFRHHYHDIESIINRISHLTDFLHDKNKM